MCPCQANTAAGRKQETISVKYQTRGINDGADENIGDTEARFEYERFLDLSQ